MKEIELNLKLQGNLMDYKGLSVLNVARSEALKQLDDDKDDVILLTKKLI